MSQHRSFQITDSMVMAVTGCQIKDLTLLGRLQVRMAGHRERTSWRQEAAAAGTAASLAGTRTTEPPLKVVFSMANSNSSSSHRTYSGARRPSNNGTSERPNLCRSKKRLKHCGVDRIYFKSHFSRSNLSVAAREFVPSNMPRNTSQWAYQQHQHQPDFNPYGGGGGGGGFGGHGDHYGGGGHFGGGGSSNSNPTSIPGVGNGARYAQQMAEAGAVPMTPPNRNVHYDPSEVLSDAIATVVFMPSKFDRTTVHLAEKFNSAVGDAKSLRKLVDSLLEQCIKEQEFQSLAGKLWTHLAQNVTLDFEGVTLKSLLIEK